MRILEATDVILWRMVFLFYSGFAPEACGNQIDLLTWKRGRERVYVGLT